MDRHFERRRTNLTQCNACRAPYTSAKGLGARGICPAQSARSGSKISRESISPWSGTGRVGALYELSKRYARIVRGHSKTNTKHSWDFPERSICPALPLRNNPSAKTSIMVCTWSSTTARLPHDTTSYLNTLRHHQHRRSYAAPERAHRRASR